ncbi:MAG: hypothetical protein RJA70_1746 [Pseudomonadota bacterium]|jgi:O-antigen ligase
MTRALSHARRLASLAPALIVTVTALFVLPNDAGGFRLAKWGAFGIVLALSAAMLVRERRRRLPQGWLPLGAFVASAVVLPAFSSSVAPTHWPTALGLLSGLALYFVTAIALAQEGDDSARRWNLVVLTVTGALCSVLVLLQAAGLRLFTSDIYTGLEFRAPGTFGNPNWAAAFLAPLVPLALGLAGTGKRRWVYYAAAILLAIASLATLSKGGVSSVVAGLFTFALLGRRVPAGRRIALVAAAAACAAVTLTLAWQYDFTQESWLRGRLFLWRAALSLANEQPLSGLGLGGYPSAYGRAAAALIDGAAGAFVPLSSVDFAHNDLLQFAAEGGLVTAAAFLVVVAFALVRAHRRGDPLSLGVGAALAAIFVNGLADSTLRVPSTFALFFFLLGWLLPTAPREHASRPRRGLNALLGVIALLGALQGVRLIAGNTFWTLGQDALRAGNPAIADLERARFWMPEHGRSASQYARALARAGRIDDALMASATAASLRFDFDDEFFRRDLQSRSLDRDAAIALWQEFSARFPMLVTPYLRLGALYLQSHDRAAAISAYETVLANPQPTARAEAARAQARGVLRSLAAKRPVNH